MNYQHRLRTGKTRQEARDADGAVMQARFNFEIERSKQ
jgi:hypothetical protein